MAEEKIKRVESRRTFIGRFWRLLAVLVAGQGAYLGLSFLTSRKPTGRADQVVTVGLASDFQPGTVTAFDAVRFFLIRTQNGGFVALHSKCTHLSCVVGWDRDQRVFACPCHGSVFSEDGSVIYPPAPRPLDYFPIVIADDGRVQVHTSRPIARSAVTGGEPVYPSVQVAQSTATATTTAR